MNSLRKLVINPENVIHNDELLNIKGGADPSGGCGTGQTAYSCSWRIEEGAPITGPGTVCVSSGGDPADSIIADYPNAVDIECDTPAPS